MQALRKQRQHVEVDPSIVKRIPIEATLPEVVGRGTHHKCAVVHPLVLDQGWSSQLAVDASVPELLLVLVDPDRGDQLLCPGASIAPGHYVVEAGGEEGRDGPDQVEVTLVLRAGSLGVAFLKAGTASGKDHPNILS